MPKTAKIVFIGAGSMSFGLTMFRDIFFAEKLQGCTSRSSILDPEALARMTELARLLNEQSGAGLTIEHTTDRRAALDGADFVLNATAIDRNRLWKLDYEIPKKHGIRQTLGENGGPGGLFFTLRTLPMVLDFARDMEELCPDALLINFSNPESRIILALAKYSRVRAVGLCEGIFGGQEHVAHIMDVPKARRRRLGRRAQSFPMARAHTPPGDRQGPLSAAAGEGRDPRPELRATEPPAVSRVRPLGDLQRRPYGRVCALWLGGRRAAATISISDERDRADSSPHARRVCWPARTRCRPGGIRSRTSAGRR